MSLEIALYDFEDYLFGDDVIGFEECNYTTSEKKKCVNKAICGIKTMLDGKMLLKYICKGHLNLEKEYDIHKGKKLLFCMGTNGKFMFLK